MADVAWFSGSLHAEVQASETYLGNALPVAAEDGQTWISGLQDDWTSFSDGFLAPLGKLLIPFVVTLALLLVLTRLLVLWVASWRELEKNRGLVLAAGLLAITAGAALISVAFADVMTAPVSPQLMLLAVVICVSVGLGALVWTSRLPEGNRTRERTASVGALVLLASLAAWTVRQRPGDDIPAAIERWLAPGAGAMLSIVGVLLTAWWLATRLRLEVKVSDAGGKESPGDAGLIVALLGELGVQKPRGLEVPRGTDVTALDGAFATLPDSPIAKTIKSIVSGIAGVTPWTASIEGSETTRAVCLSRNGRSVDSVIVRLESLGFTKTPEEGEKLAKGEVEATPEAALRMAAAFILTTLATKHISIKSGLAGATDWRSVGLHYIAATELNGPEREASRQSLLALALDHDPDNLAAQLAFRHAIDRSSTSLGRLIAYREWLKGYEGRAAARHTTALELRAKYTRTVIAVNAVFAEPSEGSVESLQMRKGALETAHQELTTFLEQLGEPGDPGHDPDLEQLRVSVEQGLVGLRRLLGDDAGPLPSPESPTGLYNLACYFASHQGATWCAASGQPKPSGDPEGPMAGDPEAVALLQLAAADPELKNWMPNDPQLAEFRSRPGYVDAFLPGPRKSFVELNYVKPFTQRLRDAGIESPALLVEMTSAEIGLAIAASTPVGARLARLAEVHESMTPVLRELGIEIVERLDQEGSASLLVLTALSSEEQTTLAQRLARDLLQTCKLGPRKMVAMPTASTVLQSTVEQIITAMGPGFRGTVLERDLRLVSQALVTPPSEPSDTNGSLRWDKASLSEAIKAWLVGL